MNDDHAEHLAAHVGLMKSIENTMFEVKWSENWFVHAWRRWRRGPKMITGREYFADAYAAMERHIPDHERLIKR